MEGKLKLNSMSGALITKKLLEKIKEQLNDQQKNYVEFRGDAEKMVGGVDFFKNIFKNTMDLYCIFAAFCIGSNYKKH